MAVFTTVPEISAKDFISRWPAGAFRSITPIASGIENTNYFVDTDSGRWVLTPQGYLVSNDIITDLLIAQDSSHPLKRI